MKKKKTAQFVVYFSIFLSIICINQMYMHPVKSDINRPFLTSSERIDIDEQSISYKFGRTWKWADDEIPHEYWEMKISGTFDVEFKDSGNSLNVTYDYTVTLDSVVVGKFLGSYPIVEYFSGWSDTYIFSENPDLKAKQTYAEKPTVSFTLKVIVNKSTGIRTQVELPYPSHPYFILGAIPENYTSTIGMDFVVIGLQFPTVGSHTLLLWNPDELKIDHPVLASTITSETNIFGRESWVATREIDEEGYNLKDSIYLDKISGLFLKYEVESVSHHILYEVVPYRYELAETREIISQSYTYNGETINLIPGRNIGLNVYIFMFECVLVFLFLKKRKKGKNWNKCLKQGDIS
ncbi:MAG: hypothetical protein ACFFBD_28710 [Candidatus Hodarchaeota archaeon]